MKVFGIAGWSGAGKTTLIEKLIPELGRRGLSVSVIKHAHKGFGIDQDGSDSQRQRVAGAAEVLLSGPRRWGLVHELRGAEGPSLEQCLARLSPCDLVIVEGFKRHGIPKIEVFRPDYGKPPMAPENNEIIAIASDAAIDTGALPRLDLDDIAGIADFIVERLLPGLGDQPLPYSSPST